MTYHFILLMIINTSILIHKNLQQLYNILSITIIILMLKFSFLYHRHQHSNNRTQFSSTSKQSIHTSNTTTTTNISSFTGSTKNLDQNSTKVILLTLFPIISYLSLVFKYTHLFLRYRLHRHFSINS